MISGRLLLATLVLLTTDPGGCHSDVDDSGPPPVPVAEARAKVDDWLRDWPLGPAEVTDCGHQPEVRSATVCTVQRQGQGLAVPVDRWPDDGPPIIREDDVRAEDPEAFVARALDLLGPTPDSVECEDEEYGGGCLADFGPGEPVREVRLMAHEGFVDAQVEVPGSGRTVVVGGGPLLEVALERDQRLDGPAVTVRGTVRANPVTGTPVAQVCVSTDSFQALAACQPADPDGGFAVRMVPGPYAEALRISASDIAGATTVALVPVSVRRRAT
ncbi:hypothetical protein [Nocardioides sp.]|uniref:hypothetical protein n=1 Tax=Nocardioides sp. TaxID=35761 RepID=UPI0035AF0F82